MQSVAKTRRSSGERESAPVWTDRPGEEWGTEAERMDLAATPADPAI